MKEAKTGFVLRSERSGWFPPKPVAGGDGGVGWCSHAGTLAGTCEGGKRECKG